MCTQSKRGRGEESVVVDQGEAGEGREGGAAHCEPMDGRCVWHWLFEKSTIKLNKPH